MKPPAPLLHGDGDDLRRGRLAPLLEALYRLGGGARRRRVAQALIDLAVRSEGGMYTTQTARHWLARDHGVTIGAFSYGECFRPGAFAHGVCIGRYVSIAEGVRAYTQDHGLDGASTHPLFYDQADMRRRPLEIGHDAWLGCRAVVTPGCHRIGLGAVVAAGAVVTRDVPDFAVVAGVPAVVKRLRLDTPRREALRDSRWWERAPREAAQVVRDAMDRIASPAGPPVNAGLVGPEAVPSV